MENKELSRIETAILQTIERVGWPADLWFPFVERKLLGFDSEAPDQDVHAAIVGLIRKGKLIHVDPEGWRPPNLSPAPDVRSPILPSPGYLRLAHRMPIVEPGPVETALAEDSGIYQVSQIPAIDQQSKEVNLADAELTELEAYILHSIDHVGWYPYLWFPVVARSALNFGSDEPEENVHAIILSLIRRGWLVPKREDPNDIPEWNLAPGILEAVERKLREISAKLPPPFPDRFSERFHIFAHGDNFDPDAFMKTSSLRPDYVWRRSPSGTSGIELLLGDGRQIKLVDQEDAAIEYLKAHSDELKALARFPGADTIILGLVWICEREQLGFCLGPSFELMQLALDIGIRLNYYVTVDGRGTHTPDSQE